MNSQPSLGPQRDIMARATSLAQGLHSNRPNLFFPKNKLFSASEEVHNASPSEGGRRFCHSETFSVTWCSTMVWRVKFRVKICCLAQRTSPAVCGIHWDSRCDSDTQLLLVSTRAPIGRVRKHRQATSECTGLGGHYSPNSLLSDSKPKVHTVYAPPGLLCPLQAGRTILTEKGRDNS